MNKQTDEQTKRKTDIQRQTLDSQRDRNKRHTYTGRHVQLNLAEHLRL
jgi:hypothetical protein